MRRWWLVSFLCVGLSGCDTDVTEGNGVAAAETRSVAAFEGAVARDGLALELSARGTAGDVSLSITGDANLLPLVETVVTGGYLIVRAKEPFSSNLGLVVRGEAPGLLRIGADAGGGAVATDVNVAGIFESAVAGGGRVVVSGNAGRFDALASDGGALDARNLTAAEVRINASGGAVVEICATNTLLAEAHDGAVITYACEPARVEPVTSGGGVVRKAE